MSNKCGESSHCFTVTEQGPMVVITGLSGDWILPGHAVDTIPAFRILRDRFKRGDFDYVGEPVPDSGTSIADIFAGKADS